MAMLARLACLGDEGVGGGESCVVEKGRQTARNLSKVCTQEWRADIKETNPDFPLNISPTPASEQSYHHQPSPSTCLSPRHSAPHHAADDGVLAVQQVEPAQRTRGAAQWAGERSSM